MVMSPVVDCRLTTPTLMGNRSWSSSRTNGITNCDQLSTETRIATDAMPGAAAGSTACTRARNLLHPSTSAASSSSRGTVSRYPLRNQVVNGSWTAA